MGTLIGGAYCAEKISPGLLPKEGQELSITQRDVLWRIFQAIGRVWKDLHPTQQDSSTLKSTWLEFIDAKTNHDPSYVAEYANAVMVIQELLEKHEVKDISKDESELKVFELFFLNNGIPKNTDGSAPPPTTRLAHAKQYVVDEFIRVNVVASGFKSFGAPDNNGRNYKGYLGGSRYNINARVRHYIPTTEKDV
jgi:hypothetical protein